MRQTRRQSATEAVTSTIIGLCLSLALTRFVMPLYGYEPSLVNDISVVAIFTVASLVRQYIVRRVFDWVQHG